MRPLINSSVSAPALLQPNARPAPSHPTSVRTNAPSIAHTDQLSLTGSAHGLQAAQRGLPSTPPLDQVKVEALRQSIAEGRYAINPQQIAQKMLELDRQLF